MKASNSKYVVGIILFFQFLFLSAQEQVYELNWGDPIQYGLEAANDYETINFDEAQYDFSTSILPFYYIELDDNFNQVVSNARLIVQSESNLTNEEKQILNSNQLELQNSPNVIVENSVIRKRNKAFIKVYPIYRGSDGNAKKISSFKLDLSYSKAEKKNRNKAMNFATSSLLAVGDWYKIAVTEKGVYKLNYNFLKSLGVDVENLDPRNLKLYGYGGGALPEGNSVDRPDDMLENPIMAVGESDGVFNRGDYFVFYGDDQVEWRYDSSRNRFSHQLNIYSDTTFYFIAVSVGNGKRIAKESPPAATPNQQVNSFDDYYHHESDLVNLIQSGREWVGEVFDNRLTYGFTFDVPDLILSEPASVDFFGVARSGAPSTFTINAGNKSINASASSTVLDRYEVSFGKVGRKNFDFQPSANPINISITYNKSQSVAKAWLNYINLNVRRRLKLANNYLFFRDSRSAQASAITQFNLQSINQPTVWNISDISNIHELEIQANGNSFSFIDETAELNNYVAFTESDSTGIIPLGNISNQNLHAFSQTDMVIVSHPNFLNQAEEIANYHRSEGLTVHAVSTEQVYNEFSSGAQDVIAIRSFMKMFYDRATTDAELPRYLLLVGDASYDLKNRVSGNTNFVVGYQSKNFLEPVNSYVSDDFLALLDDSEGTWPVTSINPEKLDIAVGRLPVKTIQEAQGVANKIKRYNTSSTLADWRNKITFVGDDGDGVTHMSQADQLARTVDRIDAAFDINKILLDAYKQESSSGGSRYPAVNEAITRAVQDGSMIINYTGHGGETGWAGERILTINDITSWNTLNNMPIFLTATCEFSRFDDPFRTSAGELVLLNGNGGGVALMTTTRLVYSSPNFVLNSSFYNTVFKRNSDGSTPRLGDVFMKTKNKNASSSNSRNFSMLGDPALKMALPQNKVLTTSVNGVPPNQLDTLKALSKVTISGYVADEAGNKLNNYNGFVYPTVFDKKRTIKTLNNDGSGVFEFDVQDNKIFKGKASVENGDFSYTFIVPKDIDYKIAKGKVIYYSENGTTDANGFSSSFFVGGSSDSAVTDNQGPEVEIYLNDESFVYGGVSNPEPVLLVKLYDPLGVNTVGSGIGHDLVAIVDGNTENAIVLNDFYEASEDNYQEGEIRYPFDKFSEGKHTVTVKAWDVANNSSEKTIEFNVVSDKEVEIENLVNYPNPFTTKTEFIFQHNQPGIPLDVKVEIFTVSGKLVKSIDRVIVNEGFLSRDIKWDGKDDFGDNIGKGVYVYKLIVRSRNGSRAEEIQKLVIL